MYINSEKTHRPCLMIYINILFKEYRVQYFFFIVRFCHVFQEKKEIIDFCF